MGVERMPNLELYSDQDNAERARIISESTRNRTCTPQFVSNLVKGVSVIVLNIDRPNYIIPLLEHLRAERSAFDSEGLLLQILVGDTGSTNTKVLEYYRSCASEIEVVRDLRYHFSRCNNQLAFSHARGDTLLFLNNDIIFEAQTTPVFDMRRALLEQPRTGIVGVWLSYEDGTLQHGGIDFFREPELRAFSFHPHVRKSAFPGHAARRIRVPAVTGACLLIRADLFGLLGGMDESYTAECQDVALCLAADRFGYESELLYLGKIVHLENGTRARGEENWADRRRFLRKWSSYIEARFL